MNLNAHGQTVTFDGFPGSTDGNPVCVTTGGVVSVDQGSACVDVDDDPVTGITFNGATLTMDGEGGDITLNNSADITLNGAGSNINVNGGEVRLNGGSDLLTSNGTNINIVSGADIEVQSGGDITVASGGNLNVSGNATFFSTSNVNFLNGFGAGGTIVTPDGSVNIGQTLTVQGATQLNSLTVSGPTNLNNNLTVNGNTQLNGNLTVQNGRTVNMGNNIVHGVLDPLADTDAANKRYVDRELAQLDDELGTGIAVALALENPDLVSGETFGIMANYGNFEGQSALGVSVMGVLGTNVFEQGDRVAIGGGVGFGLSNKGEVGGRVGIQWTN